MIDSDGADYNAFLEALNTLNTQMARKIAGDGEGADRLIECNVSGAKDVPTARALAKSVISSSLVKAAFFGKDANWGRILCAMKKRVIPAVFIIAASLLAVILISRKCLYKPNNTTTMSKVVIPQVAGKNATAGSINSDLNDDTVLTSLVKLNPDETLISIVSMWMTLLVCLLLVFWNSVHSIVVSAKRQERRYCFTK